MDATSTPATPETPEPHPAWSMCDEGPVPSPGAPAVTVLAGQKARRWWRSLRLRLCTCTWSGFRRRNRVQACAMTAVILIALLLASLWAVGPMPGRTQKETAHSQRLAMRADFLVAEPRLWLSRATDEPAIHPARLPRHQCFEAKDLTRDPLGVYDDPCERHRIARHREEMGGLAVHAEPWSLHDHVCVAFCGGPSPQGSPFLVVLVVVGVGGGGGGRIGGTQAMRCFLGRAACNSTQK